MIKTKQGTVTMDINDYDELLKLAEISKATITKDGNKVKFYFPMLDAFLKEKVEKDYKGYKPVYWDTAICFSYEKDNEPNEIL